VGCFQSQVAGAGPQLEFIIPLTTERQGYLNLKSYWEFRQPEPARRLERLGHIRDLAGGTDAEHGAEAKAHEMTAFCSVASTRFETGKRGKYLVVITAVLIVGLAWRTGRLMTDSRSASIVRLVEARTPRGTKFVCLPCRAAVCNAPWSGNYSMVRQARF
jgi:hypothetical protein